MLKQPSPEYALDMLGRVADHCVRDLGWFAELLPALRVRREHMREQAWRHWAPAIREALDPGRFVAARTLRGGPAPAESLRQAALLGDGLRTDEGTVTAARARLGESARRLEEAIDRIVGA
jgi:hypothetical protein